MVYNKMSDSKYEATLRSEYKHFFWKPHVQVEIWCKGFAVGIESTPFIYSCFACLPPRNNLPTRTFLFFFCALASKTVLNQLCEIHVMRLCTTPKQIKTTAHDFASTILLKTEE